MTLLLIDSASLWYRAYYGMPDTLVSPSGEPINAIRGFLDMTARLVTAYKPDRLALCLDGDWRPSWRVEIYPEYKSNRLDDGDEEDEPDLLTPQIPVIIEVFDALGVAILGADDYEADDVIATLSETQSGPIRIATGDRDLFQVVSDSKDSKVVYLAKGISSHDLVDEDWIAKKYGIPGARYGLFAMIRGDASDGLPGIRGIGEKGAALLANLYPNMEALLDSLKKNDSKIPTNLAKKLSADIQYAKSATKLVSCVKDVRLPKVDLQIPKAPANRKDLESLAATYGLGTSLQRIASSFSWH
jgi:5'-3' exonuclease